MKEETHNEYQKSLNRTIDFINNNLHTEINLNDLSRIAHISEYHFHRIFKAFIGEPIGRYLIRLRMEKAAQLLRFSDATLADIAEKTGYQSPFSLSKAFKKHFGITPSAFRNLETFFSSKMISKKSETSVKLTPKIRRIDPIELVYIRIIDQYGAEEAYHRAWKKLIDYVKKMKLFSRQNEYIGLSYDDPNITQAEKCRFYACISIDKPITPFGEFGSIRIEGGKFAVFQLRGSYAKLESFYQNIYYDWLPMSGYDLRNSMGFEKYLNHPDKVKESEILTEVYIPIK